MFITIPSQSSSSLEQQHSISTATSEPTPSANTVAAATILAHRTGGVDAVTAQALGMLLQSQAEHRDNDDESTVLGCASLQLQLLNESNSIFCS